MVPAAPGAPFKVIKTDFVLKLPVVHLDAPSSLGQADQAAHPEPLTRKLGQPVLRRGGSSCGPFHQELDSMVREAAVGPPAVREPNRTTCKTRDEGTSATDSPANCLPRFSRQTTGYFEQLEGYGKLLGRGAPTRSARAARLRRKSRIRRMGPCLRGRFHLDTIRQLALTQRFAELKAVAIPRIGQDHPTADAPAEDTIHSSQRQLILAPVGDLVGNPNLLATLPIVGPLRRQVQLPTQRHTTAIGSEMDRDGDLTIRRLAQSAAILPRHAYRMRPLFREAGLVDDQHGLRQQSVHQLQGKRFMEGLPGPRTLVDKLLQPLRIRLADAASDRLDRLALAFHEQAAHIDLSPLPTLRAAEQRHFVGEECLQAALGRSQCPRVHAGMVLSSRQYCNRHLTE